MKFNSNNVGLLIARKSAINYFKHYLGLDDAAIVKVEVLAMANPYGHCDKQDPFMSGMVASKQVRHYVLLNAHVPQRAFKHFSQYISLLAVMVVMMFYLFKVLSEIAT